MARIRPDPHNNAMFLLLMLLMAVLVAVAGVIVVGLARAAGQEEPRPHVDAVKDAESLRETA